MKKYIPVAFIIVCIAAFTTKEKNKNRSAEISGAVNKSLPLLQRASHTFLINAATCHSCHSEALGSVAVLMAKENGFTVNDSIRQETLDTICNNERANIQALAEMYDPTAITVAGNYDLWALNINHHKSDKMTDLLSTNIMRRQTFNGSWVSVGLRPPLEYYTFTVTALTIKNIQSYTPPILHTEAEHRIEKARSWLMETKPEANEEKVFQLLGLYWAGADKTFITQQAKKLLTAQQADGGWSQLDSLKTDAYATGQCLYALNQTGQLPVSAPAYQKGLDFLLSTQMGDGSWKVKTRSYPFVPYTESGFPHGGDQYISAAGTNWATIALILSAQH